jgi:hypothetical protein
LIDGSFMFVTVITQQERAHTKRQATNMPTDRTFYHNYSQDTWKHWTYTLATDLSSSSGVRVRVLSG